LSTTVEQTLPAATPSRGGSLHAGEVLVMVAVSGLAAAATWLRWWPIAAIEVLGFVTGGICVWLVVREHVWNWPVGLANNAVFLVMFWRAQLFADAGLQVVYMVLGVYGWLLWLRGGEARTELTISRTPVAQWLATAAIIPVATLALRALLIEVNGSAPLFDALTTVLSLTAQYMMCRKQLEHWLLWIAADLIYVPLYAARDLPLTAVLYFVFLLMCVKGWRDWQQAWRSAAGTR
jgi:nicotinamide mononucleotide transporter